MNPLRLCYGGANSAFMGQSLGKPRRVVQVAGFAGAVQPAAQIDHRRAEVRFQVCLHLKGKISLPYGHLQRTKALHQAAGIFSVSEKS